MEGDPHPGALKGRMSFQSYNPSVDVSMKINNFEAFSFIPVVNLNIVFFLLVLF